MGLKLTCLKGKWVALSSSKGRGCLGRWRRPETGQTLRPRAAALDWEGALH